MASPVSASTSLRTAPNGPSMAGHCLDVHGQRPSGRPDELNVHEHRVHEHCLQGMSLNLTPIHPSGLPARPGRPLMNVTSIWSDPATVVTVLRTWALGLQE